MKHLSRIEFVDLVESSAALPVDRLRHLESCEQCRGQAETLRAMRSMASADDTPEPSPLFWIHFSARVAEQLRGEPAPARAPRWSAVPLATWAAAAMAIVLLVGMALVRTTIHVPSPHGRTAASAAADLGSAEPVDDLDSDEAWAVVRAAAADLGWEDAHDAGISAHPGDVENVALQLDSAERRELARLLDEDLKRNGA
jgi:hypothetical protein